MTNKFALLALVLFFSIGGVAQSTVCTSPTNIVPNGVFVESNFTAATFWFTVQAIAGHAYALEYGALHSNNNSLGIGPNVYAPADTPCTGGQAA